MEKTTSGAIKVIKSPAMSHEVKSAIYKGFDALASHFHLPVCQSISRLCSQLLLILSGFHYTILHLRGCLPQGVPKAVACV